MREPLEVAGYLLTAASWARAAGWDGLARELVDEAAAVLPAGEPPRYTQPDGRGPRHEPPD